MSDYTSHIILLPQDADWRWYETLRPYITTFKITVTKSADDAGSFHGAQHTVTILQPPGAWPDGIVPFFQNRYPNARLDVFRFNTLDQVAELVNRRIAQGEVTRYAYAQFVGPFGPAPAGPSTYDSHIVLLPHGCDWAWYAAIQNYALRFRVTVAQSADDVGSFHGRNHVVTAIVYPGAWGGDDVGAWLHQHYPDAQLDLIRVTTPAELTRRLDGRVTHDDRLGRQEPYPDVTPPPPQAFRLHWPVNPELITRYGQPWKSFSRLFAASPWDYRPGLPAHEGLDFLAAAGEPVYACADGVITEVDKDPTHVTPDQKSKYPYGYFVRIQHAYEGQTYETLYAHLSEVLVNQGQPVEVGQLIGKVGSTGRSTGPHLHLNFKKTGAQTGIYRPGYVDPLLYLQWPDGWVLTPRDDAPHLYGVHDEFDGGSNNQKAGTIMQQAGVRGYLLWTESIGAEPNDMAGADYRPRVIGEHTVIVRLNNGYGDDGTLPKSNKHADFARRCGNFARNTQGVRIYVIGNEMNNPREWPNGQPIMPEDYARCFNLVYQRIKEANPDAIVCPGAVDPYNSGLYLALYNSPYGDMRRYWKTMLDNITACDGLAVHSYTHGPDPRLVEDKDQVFGNPPLETVRYHFWAFEDTLNATPERFRQLPVYLTETNHLFPVAEPHWGWSNVNNGWVWTMYQQVNAWNQRGGQQIHAAILYRYPPIDEWVFFDKPGVIEDWKQAMSLKLRPYKRRA